jgi:hypothetical protein
MFPFVDEEPLSLKSFSVLPSLLAKSSSIKDTAFKVLAFIHSFYAALGMGMFDRIVVVDSEPFYNMDRLSAIPGMYPCVSNVVATLAPFHMQKHLVENSFCNPWKFVNFWVHMLVILDYRAEHMRTRLKSMQSGFASAAEEVPEFEEEDDEDALGHGGDGPVLEVHSAGGVAAVDHTVESLLAARMIMEDEDGEGDPDADPDAGDAEEPRASPEAPRTGGVSHKEKTETKVKYSRLLFINQLLFVVWAAGSDVDNCGLREIIVEKTRTAYRKAFPDATDDDDERTVIEWACKKSSDFQFLWNQLDNELRMMIEPFQAWVIHGDTLPVHAHLGAYVLLMVYNVNAKNWKAAKTPGWVISYLGQTLYRWFGVDGKDRRDVLAVLGCICKSLNDVFVEHTNSVMRRSIPQNQTVTFNDIQGASSMIGPIRAISAGLRKMTGSTAKASKSELERNEDRAKGPRFSEARRKVGAELLRRFSRALDVAAGLKVDETARECNVMEVGFKALPAILAHMAQKMASSNFMAWPEIRGPRSTVADRLACDREKSDERAKEYAELKKTLTYDGVVGLKATELMAKAKSFLTSKDWRTTDDKTGNRRQLKKDELVALFLEKFGLAALPRDGAESRDEPHAVARLVVAGAELAAADAQPGAADAPHDDAFLQGLESFRQLLRDGEAARLAHLDIPTDLNVADPVVRLLVWRFVMSSIKTRRGRYASGRPTPAGSPIQYDGIVGRRVRCRAGLPPRHGPEGADRAERFVRK